MELIETIANLAQQLGSGKQADGRSLAYLRQILQAGGDEAKLVKAVVRSLDVPQLERWLRRGLPGGTATIPESVSGKRITLYKAALPVEAQARVAADCLIARYLNWLARHPLCRAVALAESDRHVEFFIPDGSEFEPMKSWEEFVAFVFSGKELVRTFVAALNSIRLSNRGFSVPEFPMVSEDQSLVMLAWLLRSIRSVEQLFKKREKRMTKLESGLEQMSDKERKNAKKAIEDLRKKQNDELQKYSENFSRRFSIFLQEQKGTLEQIQKNEVELSGTELKPLKREKLQMKLREAQLKAELTLGQLLGAESLLSQANSDPFEFLRLYMERQPLVFRRARPLIELYTENAARQINLSKGDYVSKAVIELVRIVNRFASEGSKGRNVTQTQILKLRPLLLQIPDALLSRSPGDGSGEFCYVCGEVLGPSDKADVNRFIFRSPYQRLQAVRGPRQPRVCRHCVAIAFVSPLKPSDQSVIIRLDPQDRNKLGRGRSAVVSGELNSFLRGLTLSQLDLAAGNYLMLTSSERIKVGKKWKCLSDVIGAVIYAHLRLADIFDHQIFLDYDPRIVAGISDIELAPHRLAFLSILINSLQLRLKEGNSINRPLTEAARHILADEPVLAIYELVSQPQIDPKRHQEVVRIEIERSLEVWTTMIGNENRAKLIADVVAMAGLLYPFVDQTRRNVREKNDPSLDPDREASKLIEEVDEVFNFIYRFADNSNYSTARLYSNPTNWFTYEQAKHLLGELGVDLSLREKAENTSRFLEVNVSDVEAAYKQFAEGDYKGDADWRAFTYRLKLALYSRFPGLGVKKEKSQ